MDMCWLLGVAPGTWNEMTGRQLGEDGKPRSSAVVADPAVALLARWLDLHPAEAKALVPQWPSPADLFARLKDIPETSATGQIDRKRLGLSLGRDATTGSRWLKAGRKDGGTPANIDRLIYFLTRGLDQQGGAAWEEYRRLALREAALRGEQELDAAPGWPSDQPKAKILDSH